MSVADSFKFEIGQSHCSQWGPQLKIYIKKKKKANGVDPDETVHNEPCHLVLHCLQKHLF